MIPNNIKELFDNKNNVYYIIDYYLPEMDNIESMQYFLANIDCIYDNNIEVDDGTQVVLTHEDYPYKIQIDAGGIGDFFSHIFEVTVIE